MLKKTTVLAAMAAIAMFAIPSLASAAWTDATAEVEANAAVSFAGKASFVGELGGISCTSSTASATLTPGTTGDVTAFGATPSSCKGSGGLAFCTVVSVTSTNLPWTAHTNGSTIAITGVHIDNTYSGAFCPYHEITLQGEVTATPDNLHAATKGTVGGSLKAYNNTTGAFIQNVTASGELSVTPSGTYGIT
jgi:hypothetical protein